MKKRTKSGLILGNSRSITNNGKVPRGLKPQRARKLIRRFHVLQKQRAVLVSQIIQSNKSSDDDENVELLLKKNDQKGWEVYQKHKNNFKSVLESEKTSTLYPDSAYLTCCAQLGDIDGEVKNLGGIEAYQVASTQGQGNLRGGDSSKKLIEWLKEGYSTTIVESNDLNALEIGCLSANNAISTSKVFQEVVKIDLNSQNHSKILQQDFMERPLPKYEFEKFNLISCSLVINFVPSPKQRGDMLNRITQFLKPPKNGSMSSLFLVLPLPCVSNSRYFDHSLMDEIMSALGFTRTYYYEAKKIAYWMYDWSGKVNKKFKFHKHEKHKGSKRNNFCITIE